MIQIPAQDLRRVAASLQLLRGNEIADCVMRSDLRQLKIELADGRMLVIGVEPDEAGRQYHLTADIVVPPEEFTRQLAVSLDPRAS